MVAQQVRHPAYGEGSIQTPVENGYVTALFAGGVRVTLPHTELELIPAFMAGDRVERGGRQGTVLLDAKRHSALVQSIEKW